MAEAKPFRQRHLVDQGNQGHADDLLGFKAEQSFDTRISQRDMAFGTDQDHAFSHTVENDLQTIARFFDVPEQPRVVDGDARLGRQLGDKRQIVRGVFVGDDRCPGRSPLAPRHRAGSER